jgi:hypothetical protein
MLAHQLLSIEMFIAQHHCNYICVGLNLAPLSVDVVHEADDKEDEEGQEDAEE